LADTGVVRTAQALVVLGEVRSAAPVATKL
jgi:hypothetical protein